MSEHTLDLAAEPVHAVFGVTTHKPSAEEYGYPELLETIQHTGMAVNISQNHVWTNPGPLFAFQTSYDSYEPFVGRNFAMPTSDLVNIARGGAFASTIMPADPPTTGTIIPREIAWRKPFLTFAPVYSVSTRTYMTDVSTADPLLQFLVREPYGTTAAKVVSNGVCCRKFTHEPPARQQMACFRQKQVNWTAYCNTIKTPLLKLSTKFGCVPMRESFAQAVPSPDPDNFRIINQNCPVFPLENVRELFNVGLKKADFDNGCALDIEQNLSVPFWVRDSAAFVRPATISNGPNTNNVHEYRESSYLVYITTDNNFSTNDQNPFRVDILEKVKDGIVGAPTRVPQCFVEAMVAQVQGDFGVATPRDCFVISNRRMAHLYSDYNGSNWNLKTEPWDSSETTEEVAGAAFKYGPLTVSS